MRKPAYSPARTRDSPRTDGMLAAGCQIDASSLLQVGSRGPACRPGLRDTIRDAKLGWLEVGESAGVVASMTPAARS